MWFWTRPTLVLQEPKISQFLDLQLFSTKIFSMLPEGFTLGNSLEGISSLMKTLGLHHVPFYQACMVE